MGLRNPSIKPVSQGLLPFDFDASVEHRRFRADSAAYEATTLKWLADKENRIERFTVSADMTPQLRKLAERVASTEWQVYENRDQETVY